MRARRCELEGKNMTEWWRGACIYQIYPRSFQDSNGDGIGDLKGIASRLEHVASLGVDAIWISPVFVSPMADMGYDVSNYTDIDQLFGNLADCDALIAKAHELGLKVIFDQVLSHTSDQHPWFQESRSSRTNAKANWYIWADPKPDASPPNNWQSIFSGPAWEWDSRRGQYYMHNFLASQPDLNFHEPEVQDAILETARFWLERGIDGFRLDTANYYFHDRHLRDDPPLASQAGKQWVKTYDALDHIHSKSQPENIAFLRKLRALVNQYPDRMLVGEIGDEGHSISTMAEYTKGDDRLHMAYSFDMLGPEFSAAHFRSRIEQFFEAAPQGWPSWSFSNHDVERHVSRWRTHCADPESLARQANALLMSMEGTIGIYQGEELGLGETEMEFRELTDPPGIRLWPEYKGRDGCRTPMVWDDTAHGGFTDGVPWLPVKAPQHARNVAAQDGRQGSTLEAYRTMIAFRNANAVLKHGRTRFHESDEPVLAFTRGKGEEALVCVFNLSAREHTVHTSGLGETTGPQSGIRLAADGTLRLAANGFGFFRSVGKPAFGLLDERNP
jgi:alpha-glucosidase